mmetsp:Transcript_6830/g.6052  ORF Transcript_6830/g.6052 Transcript_6830/m.6052 type:complete len:118 (+) Transcript_6830:4-357(+)
MGRVFLQYIDQSQLYVCANCETHLTDKEQIISKNFHGKTGKAYLFNKVVNVFYGPEEDKEMMTGLHKVCDIHCKQCMKLVGWTYMHAYAESEKYKEGKFIVEKMLMRKKVIPKQNDA